MKHLSTIAKIANQKTKEFVVSSVIGFVKKILPEGNPDYDDSIDNVKTWLVEIDEETNFPNREIGIDTSKNVIMIMPDERNYGYWTDNNLQLEDFEKHFATEKIGNEMFDHLWKEFEKEKMLMLTEYKR